MIARITSEVLVALRDNPLTPVVIAVGLGAIWIMILRHESQAGKTISVPAPPLAQLTSTTTAARPPASIGTGDKTEDAGNDASTHPVTAAQAALLPNAASSSSADVHAGEAEASVSQGNDNNNGSVHGGVTEDALSSTSLTPPTSTGTEPVAVGIARALSSSLLGSAGDAASPAAVTAMGEDELSFDPYATVTFVDLGKK